MITHFRGRLLRSSLLLLLGILFSSSINAAERDYSGAWAHPVVSEPRIIELTPPAGTLIRANQLSLSDTFAFTGATTTSNLNGVVVVDGVTYAKTDVGINAAIAATPKGATVFLPTGGYAICGTINITQSIIIKGEGKQTQLNICSSLSASTDIILAQAAVSGDIDYVRLQDFQIIAISGTPGRHGVHLSGANTAMYNFSMERVLIGKMGGNAVFADGTGLGNGTPAIAEIGPNNALNGGIVLQYSGDMVRIFDNTLLNSGPCLDISFVSGGASSLVVHRNIMTCDGGVHLGAAPSGSASAIYAELDYNEFETKATFTGSNGSYLDLDGGAACATYVLDAIVYHNSFQIVNGITSNGVRVNCAQRTQITGNRFGRGATTSKDILVTANAIDTFIGTNTWVNGLPFSSMISDSGTRTVLGTQFNNSSLLVNNAKNLSWIDDAGNQQTVLNTLGDGSVNLFGYHGNVWAVLTNGQNCVQNSAGVVAACFAPSPNASPAAGGVTSVASLSMHEITAPLSATGSDVCYGDSTAHQIKCSENNGSFFAIPQVVAAGAQALNTSAITTATCDTGVAATATGVVSSDTVMWSFNAAPTATNKYGAFLQVYAVPSANTVTFYTCNASATTSTPTAMTVNWSVRRP